MGDSIIVSSGKGGVGKTNIAISLGAALSERGKKVALIDGSLTTPDISLHLGIPFHVGSLSNILKEESHIDNATYRHKSGLKVIPGSLHIDILREFEGKKFSSLLGKLKKKNDFVLVDCAAGLGREAISAIGNCDKMLIVASPELPSIVNSSKAIHAGISLNVEPIGIILNRIGRHRHELSEDEIGTLLHEVPVIGRIPEDKKIAESARSSETVVNRYPDCSVTREFREIAAYLAGEKESLFQKIPYAAGQMTNKSARKKMKNAVKKDSVKKAMKNRIKKPNSRRMSKKMPKIKKKKKPAKRQPAENFGSPADFEVRNTIQKTGHSAVIEILKEENSRQA